MVRSVEVPVVPQPAPVMAIPKPKPSFLLIGVVWDGEYRALLTSPDAMQSDWVKLHEHSSGWRVVHIDDTHVVLELGQDRMTVTQFEKN